MSLILTFLGKGGSGRTTIALAAAKKMASSGSKVLLIGQDPSPSWGMLVGASPSPSPVQIAANLSVVQQQTTLLLERSWDEIKDLESQYLRSPTLKNIYGQELGVLPGMDQALALNSIREYDKTGDYDVIIYDGSGDLATLRTFGIPEVFSWYIRRFRQVLTESDIGKILSPFIQPITSAILNVSWTADDLVNKPSNEANDILDQGRKALANPNRIRAYLVTTDDPVAVTQAKYLWGSAQQIGLTVAGVILNQSELTDTLAAEFAPLSLTSVPSRIGEDWQAVINALPNFQEGVNAPKPLTIEIASNQVRVFLPGLAKNQVKLTQSGPELTIEAGDQRRNIDVPESLRGKPVKGAKFLEGYLIISF
ncbi:Get3/ArsA fold putative tail anchor-mediating ATPase NosAFP [Gloeothece verrucosa]|uniref:Anion-transporting ATPase n=1 Tax=Gloeothece verrucosa (strain PCC 7822) TaxID=497965 RepID=E0U9T8_GLOV7|nr:ArsA family ATPase [Gloeothece verrucosa]ADN15008.1 Anion-transporting ATPase [Gloeothece verrucosa PCC 7822]